MLKPSRRSRFRPSLPVTHILIWMVALVMMVQDADAGDGPGCGMLTVSQAGREFVVPAQTTDISLEVAGPLIKAVVRQEFTNPTDQVIAAVYVFPLPEHAAVDAMELVVGEQRIVSVVQEKTQARRTYARARDSGRRTALVEHQRPNLFTTEVANIGPGEKVTVRLAYLDQASYEDGWFALVVPLTFTPRFFPGGGSREGLPVSGPSQAAAAQRLSPPFRRPDQPDFPRASLDVLLNPGLELSDLVSPSHDVVVQRRGANWSARPRATSVPADRDFRLQWRPEAAPLARPALFVEDRPEGRYALLMIVPGVADAPEPSGESSAGPPTETVFVMDVSGSMDGPSLRQAQRALLTALGELAPGDRFNILAFSDGTRSWRQDSREVTPTHLDDARRWVRGLRAHGGTQMHPALLQAQMAFLGVGAADRARRIILLTDAAVGNEDQLLRETVARLGDIRLHVVGIGMAPNRFLVRRLAGQGGGLSLFVAGDGDDGARLTAFLARISRPQLVDPRLEWARDVRPEGYPTRLTPPFAGELVLWSGRFPVGSDLDGFLKARWSGRDLALPVREDHSAQSHGVAVRWANLKVDDLLAAHDGGGDQAVLRERVVATGLAFGLVTRFTSRVAVAEAITAAGPVKTHRIANGLPAGSTLMGELPQGGTLTPLWRALGVVLLLTGLAGWRARAATDRIGRS